jgi:hypothetical protein
MNTVCKFKLDVKIAAIQNIQDKLFFKQQKLSLLLVSKRPSIETLHCCFGHLGFENLKKTLAITDSFDLSDRVSGLALCSSYEVGKSLWTVSYKPQA